MNQIWSEDVAVDSMSVCFTGPDSAATNAGQVPDHVRPDHWEEYLFKTHNFNMLTISCSLILKPLKEQLTPKIKYTYYLPTNMQQQNRVAAFS